MRNSRAATYSGPLTWEKWNQWRDEEEGVRLDLIGPPPSDSELRVLRMQLEHRRRKSFTKLSLSELIVRDFFSWPNDFRNAVRYYTLSSLNSAEIEALVRLVMQFQEQFDTQILLTASSHEMSRVIYNQAPSMFDGCVKLQTDYSNFYGANYKFHELIFRLLLTMYGEKDFIPLITSWLDNRISRNMLDLLEFINRKDELRELPVDWALSIVRDSYADRSNT